MYYSPITSLIALVLFSFSAHLLEAQSSTTPKQHAAKRWLIIVEASNPMQSRKEGTLAVLTNLLKSEMNGQLKSGDSIGVWTFNRSLQTRQLPAQNWLMSTRTDAALKILDHVRKQKFERAPEPAVLQEALTGIAKNSGVLTVLLFSSGQGQIKGTPFDEAINKEWAAWKDVKSQRPIVTVLRSVNGEYAQSRVTPGDYAISFPPLPRVAQVAAVEAKEQTNLLTNAVVAPPVGSAGTSTPPGALIFSGPNKRQVTIETNQAGVTSSSTAGLEATNGSGVQDTSEGVSPISTNLVEVARPQVAETNAVVPRAAGTQQLAEVEPIKEAAFAEPTTKPAVDAPAADPQQRTQERLAAPHVSPIPAPDQGTPSKGRLIFGVACLITLAGVVVFLILRARARARSRISLITESINRDESS